MTRGIYLTKKKVNIYTNIKKNKHGNLQQNNN
jgi:hypothetical protein